jgi:hypothetical protein
VHEKLTRMRQQVGFTRYLGQIDIGGQPFEAVKEGIELYARHVAKAVRASAVPPGHLPATQYGGNANRFR